jgi:radical SAM protein with 4Fe4S-binding SPASM domain
MNGAEIAALPTKADACPAVERRSVDARRQRRPTLHVELTDRCNLVCRICPNRDLRRPRGFMDAGLATRLLREARGVFEEVNFSFFGEPLLHPEIEAVLAALAGRDYRAVMNTNATLLDGRKRDALAAIRLDQLRISLDSPDPATYEAIRVGAKYAAVEANTRAYLDRADRGSVRLVMVSCARNRDQHDALVDRWTPRLRPGDEVLIKNVLSWHGAIADPDLQEDRRCPVTEGQVVVGWDGTVSACYLDYEQELAFGTVDDVDLADAAADPRYRELKARQTAGNVPACRDCFDKNRAIRLVRRTETGTEEHPA